MEINQGSSVSPDLIKSVGNNLNKIGNLYFVILVANGLIFYLISSLLLIGVTFFAISLSAPANAVTYGETVGDPKSESPWAVSIWVSEENDVNDAIPICTGTLITSKLVLTAAHCVLENISYFIKFLGSS